ncbi:ATP-dependent zinc metalloprotease FtsH [Methylomonas methanica]|uniref:ATP-dependent zinc metalloprotease FtsH n=1 Tax=Methylomonas methanica (strain DSM 25384 / MC09) TaxID=857087 RepID=G0A5E4_METMM|nr:ATP-dependent zinc metalloprotease FtsH [Methylomonas methanica]AEG01650.1 ATP-dependent metalloprotease FtsH [Methylomonas methanica MC09]
MLDKHKLTEIVKTLLDWLRLAWGWLENTIGSLFNPPQQTDGKSNPPDAPPAKPARFFLYLILGIVVLSVLAGGEKPLGKEIPYSQFLSLVNDNKIDKAVVTQRFINGTLKAEDKKIGRHFFTIPLWDESLTKNLQEHKVEYVVRSGDNWLSNILFNWIIPIAIFAGIWMWLLPRMTGGAGRGFLNLGNKIKIQQEAGKITFDDVAGAESAKQELKETIEFLKSPEKLQKLGGRMPKGVLLVGSPGTGKTLLARAVSGEAGVPFFNISASEFIELFVGIGAARVRDLFEQARQKAPCIIFIDELDAIGRSRGGPAIMGGNDEREQTLNQLLTEMDGFDPTAGVVVMAATNRPEILDKALLRAGRFDRQIVVDKPDLADRIAILKLHSKAMQLAIDVDLETVAKRTPGFVGADLSNIANEAAILAARGGRDSVNMGDFEAAIDRVMAGPEKKNRVLGPEEKRRVAFHEAGHALVAETVATGQPVHKISIIPRGVSALGFTLQLPVEEKYLSTEAELKDQLAILLGGRVAEQLALDSVSTGAQNDLEKASEIARNMVCYLGMSEKLGPLIYGQRQQLQFLSGDVSEQRNYSEETARIVDAEIKALVEQAQQRAQDILSAKRRQLEQLAGLLQEKEVIQREEMLTLLGRT